MVRSALHHNQKGFSLLEVLFVLSIVSIIIVLTAPLNLSILERQQEKQFLETFQSDVLYIQNIAMTSDQLAEIVFSEDHYTIQIGKKKTEKRFFPSGWQVKAEVVPIITFNEYGTIKKSGTVKVRSRQSAYDIVFPLGKGRCYIIEKT